MAEATQTVVNQIGYNPAVAPYLQENMGQARALTYNYKMGPDGKPIIGANGMPEIESFKDPAKYGGQAPVLDADGNPVIGADGQPLTEFKGYERQAEFSDLQKQAMQGARDMATTKYDAAGKVIPTANADAQGIMKTAAQAAADASYTKNTASNQYTAPTTLGYTAKDATAQEAGIASLPTGQTATAATLGKAPTGIAAIGTAQQDTNAPRMTAQTGTAAKDIAGSTVDSRDIKAAKDSGLASLKNYQMGPAERVETKSFAQPGSADAYMSPYMQSVVGIQQREAQRAADVATTGRRGEQTRAGAFGGSRAAIMDAEAARNLATQQGDIQAQGSQEAYKQAQQQFNTEQAQGVQAQTANQQAGLTVGKENLAANLGVQQLGEGQINLQTKLANLNNEQQAAVQNESNRLQGQGLTAGQAMQAALANQGVQQQTGLANLANQQETERQNQAVGSQYGLANLANKQQTEQANAGYRQQTGMADQALSGQYGMQQGTMDQQAAMQTAANNQQAEMYGAQAENEREQYNTTNEQQTALANQAAGNRASEFGAGQGLTSAGTSAQYGQAANQLSEQSGQFGANFGLQGDQAAMQGATGLSGIAGQGYNQGVQTNQLLAGYGNQQQGAEQQRLNTQYQDFLNEQNLPYKQLGFMANTASAAPTANLGSTMYQAAPSTLSQVSGLGAAAVGAFGASGGFGAKANGGMVGHYAKGGLVRSRPQGLVALAIHSMA